MVTSPRQGGAGANLLLRLAVFGVVLVAVFVALFSRLWFLQVLATDQYRTLAKENRIRLVHSEPPRGRILDRNGMVLVDNRISLAVTINRYVLNEERKLARALRKVSGLLDVPVKVLREELQDASFSPYKPVPVALDIPERVRTKILENKEDYPGIGVEKLPVREYPRGSLAPHILGYVNEITETQLKSDHFQDVRPAYAPGDIVGQSGLEYTYDRFMRGRPEIRRVVVNAGGDVIGSAVREEGLPGQDLILTLDAKIQKATEDALEAGVAAGAGIGGAVVVMDPDDGAVRALASWPTYSPRIAADGFSQKEYNELGAKTPNNPDDDRLFNRAIQGERAPGSTYKIVTAGAALSSGVADIYETIPCPGAASYPPDSSFPTLFRNWTSVNFGSIGFAKSLEISCDTFYYELGWRLEREFGPPESVGGDGTERFQKYARLTGFDAPTGLDLPNEADGRVPDKKWLEEFCNTIECDIDTWLPGYTINMSIGQGDLVVTPLQMAVAFAAIANDGNVLRPHLADQLAREDESGEVNVTRSIAPKVVRKLPLDATELDVIQQGLADVVSGAEGTAASAFAGFPLDQIPVAGKTGTAQIGETADNDAWFISYAPTTDPEYVVAVYIEKTFGHGGEIAAPVARQIYEAIYDLDESTTVQLGQDASG